MYFYHFKRSSAVNDDNGGEFSTTLKLLFWIYIWKSQKKCKSSDYEIVCKSQGASEFVFTLWCIMIFFCIQKQLAWIPFLEFLFIMTCIYPRSIIRKKNFENLSKKRPRATKMLWKHFLSLTFVKILFFTNLKSFLDIEA